MEKFQIRDCVQLRALAYSFALSETFQGKCESMFVRNTADNIFNYIKGNADIPEYVDPNAEMKGYLDVLKDARESTVTPINMFWIPMESGIKPAAGVQVLVRIKDSEYPYIAGYNPLSGNWDVESGAVALSSNLGEVEVLAWMPIPEYKEM